MAIRYRAWTFHPTDYHSWLDRQLFVDGNFSYLLLRDVAMNAASHVNPTAIEYLECLGLRYDDEEAWEAAFDNIDPEQHSSWYMFAMADHLAPAPRLSIASYRRLQVLLVMLGWGVDTVRQLLQGYPLRWLVEDYGDEQLHRAVGRDLRQRAMDGGGGWLPNDAIRTFRNALEDCDARALDPAWADGFQSALQELTVMLDTAIERAAALRMAIAI